MSRTTPDTPVASDARAHRAVNPSTITNTRPGTTRLTALQSPRRRVNSSHKGYPDIDSTLARLSSCAAVAITVRAAFCHFPAPVRPEHQTFYCSTINGALSAICCFETPSLTLIVTWYRPG